MDLSRISARRAVAIGEPMAAKELLICIRAARISTDEDLSFGGGQCNGLPPTKLSASSGLHEILDARRAAAEIVADLVQFEPGDLA
jgi:hypothetical protein